MTRRVSAVLGATLLFAIAACGGSGAGEISGGTLRLGVSGSTGSLNLFAGPNADYDTLANIYPILVDYDLETVEPKPGFATSWERSADGLTWTFETRPGVRWSDGEPLTARDAAFTFDTLIKYQDGPTANYADFVKEIESVAAPDENTLVMTMRTPVSTLISNTATVIYILPEHVWGPFATGDGMGLKSFTNEPAQGRPVVSGGPFMLTESLQDRFRRFARNPNYFGPKVAIDGFGVRYFSNEDALVSALRNGEIDAADTIPPTAVKALESDGFAVSTRSGQRGDGMAINTSATKAEHRELLDPRVREAFEYATRRSQISQLRHLGFAESGTTIVPPALARWHASEVAADQLDLQRAGELLDSAGYPRDGEGLRTADGREMSYRVLITPDFDRTFEIVQSDFRQIGVQLEAQSLDPKALAAAVQENDYATYDLALTSVQAAPTDPDFTLSSFTCRTRGIFNLTGYCNEEYDRLYERQRTAASEDQRVDLVHQLQDMVYRSRPFVVFDYPDQIDAWSSSWTGFQQATDGIVSGLSPNAVAGVRPAAS